MLFKLLFLFTVVPLVELGLLLQLGDWIGTGPTVAVVLVTGFTGAFLARWAGASVLTQIRRQVAAGTLPSNELIEGALILVGGAMLVTAGLLTDLAGVSFLFPPTRALFRERLKAGFRKRVRTVTADFTARTVDHFQDGPGAD
jgi:UPF0716 protein FxsA